LRAANKEPETVVLPEFLVHVDRLREKRLVRRKLRHGWRRRTIDVVVALAILACQRPQFQVL
jgi:hypothetical protein